MKILKRYERNHWHRKLTGDISADSLESYVTWMEGMGTRFALADNHRDVALEISKKFKMLGYSNTRLDSFMLDRIYEDIRYQQWQYNVIATLEGIIYPDSVCIVGAHYDDNLKTGDPFSVAPGANDNASGVAAALELARVIRKNNFSPAKYHRIHCIRSRGTWSVWKQSICCTGSHEVQKRLR